jgi:phosphoribosylformylglycinamidine synthase
VGAEAEPVHLNQLIAGERRILDYGFLIVPGGFSYGDHLGAGAMLATVLRHRLMDDLVRFVDDGRPVLGICNGFQVLARLGLLGPVTLVANEAGRFECRWMSLQVRESPCIFLRGLEQLDLPIAHGQGRLVVEDSCLPDILPLAPLRYDENPNGSIAGIAGVCNAAGNVFGLMPHPERYLRRQHHPSWNRVDELPPAGGRLFANAVHYVREGI